VRGDVLDPLALDKHLAAVTQRFEIFRTCSHGTPLYKLN
jgi:hypothetical protein